MAGRKRARTNPEGVNSQHHVPNENLLSEEDKQRAFEEHGKTQHPSQAAQSSGADRSVNSQAEGGADENIGELPSGYWTEAPGHQNGGKR